MCTYSTEHVRLTGTAKGGRGCRARRGHATAHRGRNRLRDEAGPCRIKYHARGGDRRNRLRRNAIDLKRRNAVGTRGARGIGYACAARLLASEMSGGRSAQGGKMPFNCLSSGRVRATAVCLEVFLEANV